VNRDYWDVRTVQAITLGLDVVVVENEESEDYGEAD
jgi:hypothetical protein